MNESQVSSNFNSLIIKGITTTFTMYKKKQKKFSYLRTVLGLTIALKYRVLPVCAWSGFSQYSTVNNATVIIIIHGDSNKKSEFSMRLRLKQLSNVNRIVTINNP